MRLGPKRAMATGHRVVHDRRDGRLHLVDEATGESTEILRRVGQDVESAIRAAVNRFIDTMDMSGVISPDVASTIIDQADAMMFKAGNWVTLHLFRER